MRAAIMHLGSLPSGSPWSPDVRTLRWLAETTETEKLATVIGKDVRARQESVNDYSEESMWRFAADAALEFLVIPAIRSVQDRAAQCPGKSRS